MKPNFSLHHGDCLAVLRTLPADSVHAVVTDPPYGLEFMGKEWDGANGFRRSLNTADVGRDSAFGRLSRTSPEYRGGALFREWCTAWAAEALRVLKPGGHLLAFGGTRMFHHLAVGLEEAGFEVRDCLSWLYGTGFPKNRQTALKPAWEPIILARRPPEGSVRANVAAHGTGALNIDACRTAGRERTDYGLATATRSQGSVFGAPSASADFDASKGRWPANVVLDEVAADTLDAQSGESVSTGRINAGGLGKRVLGAFSGEARAESAGGFGDRGGASRFFYVAKASTEERGEDNTHPTVKPVALCRWLVRLVTPPGGTVLDPFMGSGTTGVAAMAEGFHFLGVEQSAEYLAIAQRRIERAVAEPVQMGLLEVAS